MVARLAVGGAPGDDESARDEFVQADASDTRRREHGVAAIHRRIVGDDVHAQRFCEPRRQLAFAVAFGLHAVLGKDVCKRMPH